LALTVISLCFLNTENVFSQNQSKVRDVIELKSQKSTTKGDNPNIKQRKPSSDESKGGGAYTSYLNLDNYTSYCIDVYVDGYWAATLSAFGSTYVATGNGWTGIYAESCGQTVYWSQSKYASAGNVVDVQFK
jgi:hypothetical protein